MTRGAEPSGPEASVVAQVFERFRGILGEGNLLTRPEERAPYEADWRGRYLGDALCVVRPGSTAEVAAVIKVCAEHRLAVVPQGGNTGLVGGGVPRAGGGEIVVSLSRMNRILAVDRANSTISVEAGCTLAAVQAAAQEVDRLFPLSLASEGSCQIGGNLASNAGGVQVLRYGNMREMTLGIEAVLPDGRIWNGLRGLRKDNTGYDLKQLFVGSEGTLGIITAAVLKLFPQPRSCALAWVAVTSPAAAIALLDLMRDRAAERLSAFELVGATAFDLVLRHMAGASSPLMSAAPWYALIELTDSDSARTVQTLLEDVLGLAVEQNLVTDAAIAANAAQRANLWSLREWISEAQKIEGISIKHDISLPVSRIPEFLDRAGSALVARFGNLRIVAFGHAGDGNLHYNLSRYAADENPAFIAQTAEVNQIVHDMVARLGGSISAEHGLGQLKREEIRRYKSGIELEIMRGIKQLLDPAGIMNPGKVL